MPKDRAFLQDVLRLAAVVTVVCAARSSLADHYHVPTGSMEPTVQIGDHLLVDKAAYGLRLPFTHLALTPGEEPRTGDVVVLESPVDGTVLLKRVAATPGDTVAVRDGRVWLDGHASLPNHPIAFTPNGGPDYGPIRLGRDEYLVLGDNRGQSFDGRLFGLVTREAILGKASGIVWRGGGPTWRRL